MNPESTELEENGLIEELRTLAQSIPDLNMEIDYPVLFSSKAPIEVELYGYDLDTMKTVSKGVSGSLARIPGIVDVRSNLQPGSPEVQIIYDRKRIVQLGLELRPIAELVRNKIQGNVATTFRKLDRQIDIRVRLEEEDRYGLDDLKRLIVNPRGEFPIQLSAVADFIVKEGANEVRHIDQQRGTVIYTNVAGIDLAEASRQIQAALRDFDFPSGFSFDISGQQEEMENSTSSMLFALGLALFLVYIVMASQFESLLHPFIILFTVPLAMIGVLLTLYAGGWTLNILVFIGLIMLAGIVVNNAIVLVDYINTLQRRDGIGKMDAIQKACLIRFRPILMTTLTTVLGMLPMALGLGEGAEIRVPLAITVIAGLSTSTLLTLIVIPCAYSLIVRETKEAPV
jgi:HAE1 family hydrophobic/amphiphilic exporter-1